VVFKLSSGGEMMKSLFGFFGLLTCLLGLGFSSAAFAAPAQVVIIRHAEKPDDGSTGLTAAGEQRAQELVGFFENNPVMTRFGRPAAIFATNPEGESERPVLTITPTANAFGLPVDSSIDNTDVDGLVSAVMNNPSYEGRTVIICWHHGTIPEIATAFGARNVPRKWKGSVYDQSWVLQFSGNQVTSFVDVPQGF
jgi:hypothetical protein